MAWVGALSKIFTFATRLRFSYVEWGKTTTVPLQRRKSYKGNKMADQLLKQAQNTFEGQIVRFSSRVFHAIAVLTAPQDFEGQKTTELLSTILLTVSGVSADPQR